MPHLGLICTWKPENGYGFITPDAGEPDVFVHIRDIEPNQPSPQVKVPHFNEIEDAGHKLGRFLSRLTQSRLANEVAAGQQATRPCPTCGQVCQIEVIKRTVTGIDGPFEMMEPKAHCPACRRDFFPSA